MFARERREDISRLMVENEVKVRKQRLLEMEPGVFMSTEVLENYLLIVRKSNDL